ncbi:MAG: DegV family protein [Pelosinus sp.]|nr:DegV family protein [Pelosinus sp.]
MKKVHIVVDSTFRISAELLARHSNLHIVSLKLRLGQDEWPETELSADQLLLMAKERGLHPTTSQPAPGDFLKVFEPLIQAGREIVMITVAGGLSGTVQGARMAAKMVNSQKIQVVDSTTTSVGGVKLTEAALQMAAEGLSSVEIAERLTRMAEATNTILIPGELTFLQKGGRIGGAAALIGNILQIKPLLFLDREGKVAVLEKVRTKKRALLRAVEEVKKCGELEYLAIGYIGAEAEAVELSELFQAAYPELSVLTDMLSPVITAHVGPGTVGFVYQQKLN